ncbi:MAG: endonuclease MutS2 [Oscillospiraceae bacterium]|jgi:DNA mismatch repair protein MutS2|nr:endonuclease MutS2 [Oscillospiraceae bacterium]
MTELYEKSIGVLELPAVLELLSAEAVSEAAKDLARELRPAASSYEVERALRLTTAAKSLLSVKGSPSFSGVRDVRAALSRADLGGALNMRELLEIAELLRAARSVKAYSGMETSGDKGLDGLFSALSPNKYLEERIFASIISEEEMADSASSELSDIRRHIRAALARIRDALQKVISSPSYAKALQEPIITTRSGRYVVPVKAEHKGEVPGLVHDVSSSGATLFIEPLAVVKGNNEVRELRAQEKQEIERILAELSAECAASGDDIGRNFLLLVELDGIFARARLSETLGCTQAELSEREIVLKRARHPLLPRQTAVPLELELGGDFDTLVITGPNTGGKTVALKTIGLLCVMTYCGLHIPVMEGSRLPLFDAVLADIGDEQSIEQSLSTFSSHMTNISRILSGCGEKSLLLFDELGAGTDPVEGAALATAIIEYARGKGATIAATTHYAELKIYATTQDGVMNASCEFDVESLRPTFRLLIGVPGKSNAFAISSRLGLPEELISDARSRVDAGSAGFEATLETLEAERQRLEKQREETERLLNEARENEKKSARALREASVRLEKADERARRDAERIVIRARETAESVFAELSEMRRRQEKSADYERENLARTELLRQLNTAEEALAPSDIAPPEAKNKSAQTRPARVGDGVWHRALGIRASVLEALEDGTLSLQAGAMKLRARQDEVQLLDTPAKERPGASGAGSALREAMSSELDLRGMSSDEALLELERYIDGAARAALERVTIIHGKGTGVLRTAVRKALKSDKAVKAFRPGLYGEGEDGVTIAELK